MNEFDTTTSARRKWIFRGRSVRWLVVACTVIASMLTSPTATTWGQAPAVANPDGNLGDKAVARCVSCHSLIGGMDKFHNLSPLDIYTVLRHGAMMEMTTGLSDGEMRAAARTFGDPAAPAKRPANGGSVMCESAAPLEPAAAAWPAWSNDSSNVRNVRQALSAKQLADYRVKWVFGFPDTWIWNGSGVPIAMANGRLYVGSTNRWFYAIDASSGCTRWAKELNGWIRGGAAVAEGVVVVGDSRGYVYGFDELTGNVLWSVLGDPQVGARVTGSITVANGKAFVPFSTMEMMVQDLAPSLPCCTFNGGVSAFDIHSGKRLWQTFMLERPVESLGKNEAGGDRYGPSGVAIWTAPTIDEKRGVLYVGTSHQISGTSEPVGNAVVALDLATGAKRWVASFDADSQAAIAAGAKEGSRDGDIPAPPMLLKRQDGREVLVVGSKESFIYELDPDAKGAVLWQVRIGAGGNLGGVSYGMASDGQRVYVPLYDRNYEAKSEKERGVSAFVALDLMNGKTLWRTEAPTSDCKGKSSLCEPAFYSPATVVGDVVLTGTKDGLVRALDKKSGKPVWGFDTAQAFKSVNGIDAQGGSFSMGGIVMGDGMMFVNSGSAVFMSGMPGNALVALEYHPSHMPSR